MKETVWQCILFPVSKKIGGKINREFLNHIPPTTTTTTTTCYLSGDPQNSWQEHDEDSCSCLPESLAKLKGFSAGGGGKPWGKFELFCCGVGRLQGGIVRLVEKISWFWCLKRNVLVTSSRLETNLIFFLILESFFQAFLVLFIMVCVCVYY